MSSKLRFPDEPRRGAPVRIDVSGRTLEAFEGEMLAAVLWASGLRVFRQSAVAKEPRGPLCFMGVCQECPVIVDGRVQQSCMITVRDGLKVELMAPELDAPERTAPELMGPDV